MKLSENNLWKKDIEKVLTIIPELSDLAGGRIMVTGGTGLICSAIVDVLARWNRSYDDKIYIYAVARDVETLVERFGGYINEQWFETDRYDATLPISELRTDCDYIIHGAGNASPRNIIREPVETMCANLFGLINLLEYVKNNKSKRLLFVSSSEVYGQSESNAPFRTNDYGYVDILNPRSSYSCGKRAAETLCVSYADEYDVDSVIVRPGHIYGPTAKKNDRRVSSMWAYKVARSENIVMKSSGTQIRSYCYAPDAASAILKVLMKGKTGNAYNISNPNSVISIRELAEIMAKVGNVNIRYELPDENEKKGFNPMPNSSLDAKELMKLGWKNMFDSKQGIEHTIRILRNLDCGQG